MARRSRTMTISLPPELYAQVEELARREHRTHSELVREAVRRYSERRVNLDRLVAQGEELRKRLGLPEPELWTDEEIAEFAEMNESGGQSAAKAVRETRVA